MKNKLLFVVSIIIITILSIANISLAQSTVSEAHEIKISEKKDFLKVEESLTIIGDSDGKYSTLSFWITNKASEITITINDTKINEIIKNDNIYSCNASNLNLSMDVSINVNLGYNLEQTISEFEKKLLRDTENIILKYNEETRYSAEQLKSDSKFNVKIEIEPEQQTLNIYTIITIILLIILLIVFTIYYFKKQKTTKKKEITGVSKELLVTKKTLLMSLLKDIEKQHRAKKISDDTYNKIKEQYKNEAVDTMKKLEDMDSEIS